MNKQFSNYECVKCKNKTYQKGEIKTTSGSLTAFFNIQNQRFFYISCTNCGYTEFYRGNTSTLENVLDFFGN
ncbi:MAG: GTP-binding protein [Flavobacteriaceae bacterium]|nr:GTP-binding protein [Flavobacteriaceae bacterium]